jgi:MoaA/NifB/PqqE/SkfB family radical SAM enzyme
MSNLERHWGLEFSPEEIIEFRARNGLLSLELELSRVCNLHCIYCYASSGVAMKNELSLPEILDVVDQVAALGARKIIVIVLGGGEPLLYPYLVDVIGYSKGVSRWIFPLNVYHRSYGPLSPHTIPINLEEILCSCPWGA